jgi:lipopolysaccharide/colanic/teichoic acid biosynthesis glycosyltransferase
VNLRSAIHDSSLFPASAEQVSYGERRLLGEEAFQNMISLERKRSERSQKAFVLMLLDTGGSPASKNGKGLRDIASALLVCTRETDVTGWYKECSVLGVILTELPAAERHSTLSTMLSRVTSTLKESLTFGQLNQISISFYLFPDDWIDDRLQGPSNRILYPDLTQRDQAHRAFRVIKRIIDVIGSLAALILLFPLFLTVAIAIKATSRGPAFFRQRRIGQNGKPFVFLKFRSMFVGNDASIHRIYVQELIAGHAEKQPSGGNGEGVYKLTKDPRVTRVGAVLRKTSLDELPQFINVLRGEMSLVGPRPPLPYEVDSYDIWHRRRLLEAKPGITGLWQVNGRSRVTFDDMVRLDLQYARTYSLWTDIKILLRTPGAVIVGEGAH